MRNVVVAVLACAGAGAFAPAFAHPTRDADIVEIVPPEAAGCYYRRGERYCGRYCYWEINGKRYCQPRARDAWPQAEFYLEEAPPPPARRRSMK